MAQPPTYDTSTTSGEGTNPPAVQHPQKPAHPPPNSQYPSPGQPAPPQYTQPPTQPQQPAYPPQYQQGGQSYPPHATQAYPPHGGQPYPPHYSGQAAPPPRQFLQPQPTSNIAQSTSVVLAGGAGQAPVIIQAKPGYDNFASSQAKALSVILWILGALAIIFDIVAITIDAIAGGVSLGIPIGCLFIITGCLGFAAGTSKQHCTVVATMVLAIFSAVFAFYMFIASAISTAIDDNDGQCFWEWEDECREDRQVAMDALLMIVGLIAMVIVIWLSVLCCSVACCGRRAGSVSFIQPVPVQRPPQGGGAIVVSANQSTAAGGSQGYQGYNGPPPQAPSSNIAQQTTVVC